jgi:hypothetical protein
VITDDGGNTYNAEHLFQVRLDHLEVQNFILLAHAFAETVFGKIRRAFFKLTISTLDLLL